MNEGHRGLGTFRTRVGTSVRGKATIVASGPDFAPSLLEKSRLTIFVNGSLEHWHTHGKPGDIWFVTEPLLKWAGVSSSEELEERKRLIAGARPELIIASTGLGLDGTTTALEQLGVRSTQLLVLSRGLLREMILECDFWRWALAAYLDRRNLKSLASRYALPEILQFATYSGKSRYPGRIPFPWKPSGGVQAVMFAEGISQLDELAITGISLGTDEYLRGGRIVAVASKRRHLLTDELVLRRLAIRKRIELTTTSKQTALRTGISLFEEGPCESAPRNP